MLRGRFMWTPARNFGGPELWDCLTLFSTVHIVSIRTNNLSETSNSVFCRVISPHKLCTPVVSMFIFRVDIGNPQRCAKKVALGREPEIILRTSLLYPLTVEARRHATDFLKYYFVSNLNLSFGENTTLQPSIFLFTLIVRIGTS